MTQRMTEYFSNGTCNISGALGTLNYSDSLKAKEAEHNLGETLVNVYILPCLMVIGLAFNFAFLIVVIRIRWMRNITNIYLINLCIADMIFLIVGVGDKLSRYLVSPIAGDQYIYKMSGCILVYFVINAAHFAVLFFITLITFERFYTICKPLHRRFLSSTKKAFRAAFAVWCCALAFALGMVPSTRNFEYFCVLWPDDERYVNFPTVAGHCLAIAPWVGLLANGIQTVPFFIALIINSILYIKIFKRLNTMVDYRRDSNAPTARVKKIREQISRMLIANGVVFFVFVTPWTLYSLVFEILVAVHPEMRISIPKEFESVLLAFRVLLYCNSVANPLLFNFASERYRHAFLDAFVICKKVGKFCGRQQNIMQGNGVIEGTSEFSLVSSPIMRNGCYSERR